MGSRPPSKKKRRRERRAAQRHGLNVEQYRRRHDDKDTDGYRRFEEWRSRQEVDRE